MKSDSASGPKSQIIALVLVLLVGYLGIHRFYLGYTGIGIIQLLTAGGCGIWALIDLIRIITGDLVPADGSSYDPTL
ncbi:MAG: TM2 domain-containing protein [Saprospirales bacterium]|nr:TM2 domain-containing protein [Saprospirales bacterium]MBK6904181.1 TM2 domain-containing protein [Saprospirales bacterium]MBK7338866.1 TM2 domain-containing protein [Saprospirales bacterium]